MLLPKCENMEYPNRKHPRLKAYDYSLPGYYYVTVCAADETICLSRASPRPTLADIMCAYKSLTTRELNRAFQTPGKKWFQTSFYETVLRNEQAYQECWKYIDDNPMKLMLGYHR